MKRSVRNWILLIATSLPCMWLGIQFIVEDGDRHDNSAAAVKVQLDGVKDRADLIRTKDGDYEYVLFHTAGPSERISPDELASRIHAQQRSRNWLDSVFNVSSPLGLIWVGIGLIGQALFTGRMVVQWIASEKSRKSVVPPVFWWMSLIGSMMLLTYFVWRRDIVGMLGQSFGLVVYVRNIYLLSLAQHHHEPPPDDLADGPEDEDASLSLAAEGQEAPSA